MLINQILKKFQQRVICNNECYSFRFTLFFINSFFINLIQDGRGGKKAPPPTSFSPVTSTNVGISPKLF